MRPRYSLAVILIALALVAVTVLSFYPVVGCRFVNFDDDRYVTANPIVQQGLTWNGVVWAFTSTPLDLWHPLSFISLMGDFEMFGLEPGGYHLMNLLIHTASVALLFTFLSRVTKSVWRSAAVSALFALHPLRVESVAWVAERKDVLAMCLGLLALLAYGGYAKRPAVWRYAAVAAWFTLSLLAKPMFLILPGLLLLLDYWPLGRLASWKQAGWRLLEKIPLLLISVGIVLVMQAFAGKFPPRASDAYVQDTAQRQENAVISYVLYLEKMVDIGNLAVLYPIRPPPPVWKLAGAALLLAAITAAALALARSRPWLAVGWGWFVISLLPVIGVGPQVGFHSMADRYTYLPCIGVFIAIVWSVPARWGTQRRLRIVTGVVAAAVLLTLCLFTRRQIGFWHDSVTLFEHASAVTTNNDFAEYSLGCAYWLENHDAHRSIEHFETALRIRPNLASAHDNLAMVLTAQKPVSPEQFQKAIAHYRQAVGIDPTCYEAYENWGFALFSSGDFEGAVTQFRAALKINSGDMGARKYAGIALLRLKKYDQAITELTTAMRQAPNDREIIAALQLAKRRGVVSRPIFP